MDEAFFPFNPRAARLGFALGAIGCAALTLWAVLGSLRGTERMGELRAILSAVLMLAFLRAFLRIRPRVGWGVALDAEAVTLARPFSRESLRLPWSRIANVCCEGRRRDLLVLVLENDERVQIARHLFARRATFEALFNALRERVPEPVLDA